MALKLYFLTTEITPFAQTSPLGVFSARIPLALQGMGHDIRTIIPKYGFVSERKYILREVIRLREIPFLFEGSEQMASAKSAFIPKTRVQVYFLEHADWFKPLTNLLYKSKNGRILSDNDTRYAFYGKAALATLPHLFWKPDVLLCNNWQSTFVPVLYQQQFANEKFYGDIKTVLLIHSFNEYTTFSRVAYHQAGLELPPDLEGETVNGYEVAAHYADQIIALDREDNKLSEKLLQLPGIKAVRDKFVTIPVPGDEKTDHNQVAARINAELVKLST